MKPKSRKINAKAKLIKTKAQAYLTKSKGKALRKQASTHESEMTKRTALRSAALSNAVTQGAKYRAQAAQSANQWNSIINGPNTGYQPNKDTSDVDTSESTTNPDRIS